MKFVKLILLIILLAMLSSSVTAFSSQYLENKTFRLLKGHTDSFRIVFQNPDEETKVYKVDVNSTEDIASLEGEINLSAEYVVEPNVDREIFILIDPKREVKLGEEFDVEYNVREILSKEGVDAGAMISIGPAFKKLFKVLVVSQNAPKFDQANAQVLAYAGEAFEYDVRCSDLDGDELIYVSSKRKLKINDDGIMSYKFKWRGKAKTEISCTDGLEVAHKNLIIVVKDTRWFTQYWFIALVLVLIGLGIWRWKTIKKQEQEQE